MSVTVTIVDREAIRTLWTEVEGFYVRDRALKRAQTEMQRALNADTELQGEAVRTYITAVRRYFQGFQGEAKQHLRAIDRKLDQLAQLQFNATAERGVAMRRVEVTQSVLARVDTIQKS